ncbi:hypothetical protein [Curtobacterium sp. MCSS17_016]|uniref:hypothetical protein n=1 Tax=Curtobacterium sp. MCSS17_016 TaxID=2175644 RepID=UPI000DA84CD3|nr:hypothetical protein [Curtobacterium sp. MCSS17_016]WIE81168.1 hypothetical protein DEJ19_018215 [Curtobacterium sp. MCSS17_016]
MTQETFHIAGEHAADRLMRQQALTSQVYLGGDQPPTPRQVAAVLHALSDHTHLTHLLSDDVAALAADRDGRSQQADGAGRYLQGIADHLRGVPARSRPAVRQAPQQRWPLGTAS